MKLSMTLIEKVKFNDGVRYGFDTGGVYYSWCEVDENGEWVDGTFKKDSDPQKKQMKLINQHIKKVK